MRLLLLLPSTSYRAAAFVDAARRLGLQLTVGSDHRSVFGAANPEGLLALDFADAGRAVDAVMAFARGRPVAAVFGVDDDTAALAALCAEALGQAHATPAACELARDKFAQRTCLAAAGVRVPAFARHRFSDDLGAAAARTRYPCVLKPTRLSMSRGVIRADDPAGFVAAARRIEAIVAGPDAARACGHDAAVFLAEDFVAGPEVALEGLLRDGALTMLALFDKPDPLDGPYFEETIYVTPSALAPLEQEAIRAEVERACAAMGLERGPVHAEVRWSRGAPVIIEVAARPIGGRCSSVLAFEGGRTLEEVLLREAMNGWTLEVGSWTNAPDNIQPPTSNFQLSSGASAVLMLPTPRAGTLVAVDGVDAARTVPGVTAVEITAHPGQELVPLPEGNRYLGFVFARAEAARQAVAALRAAQQVLRVRMT